MNSKIFHASLAALAVLGVTAGTWAFMTYIPATAGPVADPDGWKIVFEDEFDGTALDLTKWNYNYHPDWPNGGHTHNHEAYMAEENVVVTDGLLRIVGENRRHPDAPPPGESPWGRLSYNYTAGAVTTFGKFNFTRGYVEGRFRMPSTKGLWPAFWMLNVDGSWPPEIDVLEFLSSKPSTFYGTYHYNFFGAHRSFGVRVDLGYDMSLDFHTYAVEWDTFSVTWFVDGVKVGRSYVDPVQVGECEGTYLIVNLAVGGWEDDPDASTVWPAHYDCDYVRVWQRT